MARKKQKAPYSLFGLIWRLVVAGAVVFALTGAGSYFLAERLIKRPEAPAPNLLTLDLMEALERSSEQGFALLVERHEPSDLLKEGCILSQRPEPEMTVKEGTTIRVVVAETP